MGTGEWDAWNDLVISDVADSVATIFYWNARFPPTPFETARNAAIASFQGRCIPQTLWMPHCATPVNAALCHPCGCRTCSPCTCAACTPTCRSSGRRWRPGEAADRSRAGPVTYS